jgi:hypothetical protein
MTNNIFYRSCLALVSILFLARGNAQISISGSTCVVPGTIYQYVIDGNFDSGSSAQICITAGSILDSANGSVECLPSGKPINRVLVKWNDSAAVNGALNLTSSAGKASIRVQFTRALQPGLVDSSSKLQIIGLHEVPLPITCYPDSGGSCSPSYSHQWQQSQDRVNWSDISLARGQTLTIESPLTQSTYYRRKVTETVSGSIGYSDVASVFVMPSTDSTYHARAKKPLNRADIAQMPENDQWADSGFGKPRLSFFIRNPADDLTISMNGLTKRGSTDENN